MEQKLSFGKYCPALGSPIGNVVLTVRARVQGIEAKSRVLERAQSWIFGLRRADVARARSSQCCFCGTTRVTIGHCRRRECKKEREPVTTC